MAKIQMEFTADKCTKSNTFNYIFFFGEGFTIKNLRRLDQKYILFRYVSEGVNMIRDWMNIIFLDFCVTKNLILKRIMF